MKRTILFLLATGLLSVGQAQEPTGPAAPPSQVQMQNDGRCMDARPGDTVRYSLTIQDVEDAKAIVADLQLRLGGHARLDVSGGLPPLDFKSIGGGGVGARDQQDAKVYHFVFRVPTEIYGGLYRGVGVVVRTDETTTHGDLDRVDVTRHVRDQIAHYCLNVVSNFGGENRPAVTNFAPGPVEPKK